MNRPLTDRDRILQLEARVAELQGLVDAYEAESDDEARWARDFARVRRTADAMRGDAMLYDGRRWYGLARVLLDLLDHTGRVRSKSQVYRASRPGAELPDTSSSVADILICRLRKVVGAEAIRTVWGQGWEIVPAQAAALRQRLGLDA